MRRRLSPVGARVGAAAVLTACALAITACGGGSDEEGASARPASTSTKGCDPAKTTLRLAYLEPNDIAVQAAKAEMERKHPGITVQASPSSAVTYQPLTEQVVSDINGGKEIDIVISGLNYVRFWADTFKPSPIDPDKLPATYDKRYLSLGDVEGVPYLAPFQVTYPALYMNVDVMKKAGLDPTKPPRTTTELLEYAEAVKSVSDVTPAFISADTSADWYTQALIQSGGASLVDADGRSGFNTDEGRKALSVYHELATRDLTDRMTYLDAVDRWSKGKLAFFVAAASQEATYQKQIGDNFEWTIARMPVPDGGSETYPAGGNGWIVLARDRCKAAFANEMVGYMLTSDTIAESTATFSYLPVDTRAAGKVRSAHQDNPQFLTATEYDGELTPWGGWPGSVGPKAILALQTMTQKLADGQNLDAAVADAATEIDGLGGS